MQASRFRWKTPAFCGSGRNVLRRTPDECVDRDRRGRCRNILSGDALALYLRLERFGLLIIMAAVFFVPQLQVPLSRAIFGLVMLITTPFGVSAVVGSALRSVLVG